MNYVIKHKFLIVILLALLIGAFFWWRSGRETGAVIIEETAEVQSGSVRKILSATGIVKSQVGAVVKTGTRATGVIEKMLERERVLHPRPQLFAVVARELHSLDDSGNELQRLDVHHFFLSSLL